MNDASPALEAFDLGKRFRRGWALQDCSFSLQAGAVAALVGPNSAGKSTLLALAAGILTPTTGSIKVMGEQVSNRGPHPKLAFLSQDKPLYRRFTVDEMLKFGRSMNTSWDDQYARRLIADCNIPLSARTGTLSGGERTRVALAIALGRRPAVLLLDEPLAALDPVARIGVMQTLLAEVVDTGISVVLSAHVIADIEDACEHLLLLTEGRLRLDGPIEDLLTQHRVLIGSAADSDAWLPAAARIDDRTTQRQHTIVARNEGLSPPPGWTTHEPTLEELVLAYLRGTYPAPTATAENETRSIA